MYKKQWKKEQIITHTHTQAETTLSGTKLQSDEQ